jgi:hypothetical protein
LETDTVEDSGGCCFGNGAPIVFTPPTELELGVSLIVACAMILAMRSDA